MKKVTAMLLCVLLVLSMSVTAYASELSYDGASASSTIYYTAPNYYNIVIPESIWIADGYTFEATIMNIMETQQVNVCISNLNENGELVLEDAYGNAINIWLTNLEDTNVCAKFTADNLTSSITFYGQLAEGQEMPKAGEYSGVVEFSVTTTARDS